MSFFESIPKPPPPEPVRRRRPAWQRSDAVIPGSVSAELVLARTEQVAVAIGSIRAYPNGFEFALHARLRREDWNGPSGGDPLGWHAAMHRKDLPSDILRLGVMYADGRRAATTGGDPWPSGEVGGERLILVRGGGGGNERTWDGDVWVYPLPPEGAVTFVISWLRYGIAETRTELDSAVIRAAARHAVILWPEDEEFESGSAWSSHTITASSSDDPSTEIGPD